MAACYMLPAEVDAAPLNAPEGAGFVFGGMAVIHAGHAFVHLLDPHEASRLAHYLPGRLHTGQLEKKAVADKCCLMRRTWCTHARICRSSTVVCACPTRGLL